MKRKTGLKWVNPFPNDILLISMPSHIQQQMLLCTYLSLYFKWVNLLKRKPRKLAKHFRKIR